MQKKGEENRMAECKSHRNTDNIKHFLRKWKYEGKCENNNKNGQMVMLGMIGWRRRDRTVPELPSSYPFFSLMLFSNLFCSNASQRRSKGKSAPSSRSWKQTSLQLHPNELFTELVLHSYHCKHMQILISGVQVWPFSQTQEGLPNINTSVHCNSLSLFILHCLECQGK